MRNMSETTSQSGSVQRASKKAGATELRATEDGNLLQIPVLRNGSKITFRNIES